VPENKPKKTVSDKVRIPDELRAELRRVIGEAQLRGERPPAAGDLLLAAWRAAAGVKRLTVEPKRPALHQRLMECLDVILANATEQDLKSLLYILTSLANQQAGDRSRGR
jgi:hypothetical protein